MRLLLSAACIGICLSGCAGLDVHRVTEDKDARGYRYYDTAMFLMVTPDGKGGVTSQILALPDTTHVNSARPYAFLASNNTTLSFSNGTLTEASLVGDETAVPNAFLDALTKGAVAGIAAADLPGGSQARTAIPAPYLFKITVNGTTVNLKGGQATGVGGKPISINVNLVASGGKN